MTIYIPIQFGALSRAQFLALPPHVQLHKSELLVPEMLLYPDPTSDRNLRRFGLVDATPEQIDEVLNLNTRTVAATLPKRPLNSWMAFRSYYTRIFANLQQKNASRHLTKLWNEDPFKAKWTIIARAYTRIRDLVGTERAPLDTFLEVSRPAIGIIRVEEYLTKLNWSLEVAKDGTLTLHQTSSPYPLLFGQHIMHTSMSDIDLIVWAAVRRYIPMNVASYLASNGATRQQNVLAAAPVFQYHAPHQPAPHQPAPLSVPFLQTDPVSAASMVLGFDVNNLVNTNPYEWTGSMSDLYSPDAGFIDIESIVNNEASDEWEVSNIQDPLGFESLFEGVIEGGYSTPIGILSCSEQSEFPANLDSRR